MAKRMEREKSRGREQITLWLPRHLKRWVAQAAKDRHRGNMTYYIEHLILLQQTLKQRKSKKDLTPEQIHNARRK